MKIGGKLCSKISFVELHHLIFIQKFRFKVTLEQAESECFLLNFPPTAEVIWRWGSSDRKSELRSKT